MRITTLIVLLTAVPLGLPSVEAQDAPDTLQAEAGISPQAAAVPKADLITAGHILRRLGFGPTPKDLKSVQRIGLAAYLKRQLNPSRIGDSLHLPRIPKDIYDAPGWQARWYARMVGSHRHLQQKMTLTWHELFATSNDKVQIAYLMHKQEDLLRKYSLGKFSDLLSAITKDQAMLIWLDNDGNDGNATDDNGNLVVPNRNYAREMMQIFSMGPVQLNMDGTPVLDPGGATIPNYTEDDITELARALTGWRVDYDRRHHFARPIFDPNQHDSRSKTFLGVTIAGRTGKLGAKEVDDAVAIIMAQPSVAPYISRYLIQKLATETPTPDYVSRVASVFQSSKGSIRDTVQALVLDPEFLSPDVVRTQYRTPIEHFVGMARALSATTKGDALTYWTYFTNHMVYYPPSVFSFYAPGDKSSLVNSANLTYRDRFADDFVASHTDTAFDAARIMKVNKLTTPEQMVDYLATNLLAAPLSDDVRNATLAYIAGRVDDRRFRGAAWLVICSPDFQRN
jgi:uncharacterized protein (DUF1800 family)